MIVYGQTFKASLLIDVASQYYLGVAVSKWANAALVEEPVNQALAKNGGHGPQEFLLSDNGSPYVYMKIPPSPLYQRGDKGGFSCFVVATSHVG